MLWLCQITFAGVGAIATAQFATENGWPFLLAVVAGGVVAAVIGVVLGLLTIRLGNLYVALVTLTFGLLMETPGVHPRARSRTRAPASRSADPSSRPATRRSPTSRWPCSRSSPCSSSTCAARPPGLALNAVRWSETASRTMGLSVLQMKVLISALAAFVAGVGGGLFAAQQKQALPTAVRDPRSAWRGSRCWSPSACARTSPRCSPRIALRDLPRAVQHLPHRRRGRSCRVLLFGLGAIAAGQEPRGHRAHAGRCSSSMLLRKLGGARPVPAATAVAGRHDPRLHPHDDRRTLRRRADRQRRDRHRGRRRMLGRPT